MVNTSIESHNQMIYIHAVKLTLAEYMDELIVKYIDTDDAKLFNYMMECHQLNDTFSVPDHKLIEFNLIRSTRSTHMWQRLTDIGLVEDIDFIEVPVSGTIFTEQLDQSFGLTGKAFIKVLRLNNPCKLNEYYSFIQSTLFNYMQYEVLQYEALQYEHDNNHDNNKSTENDSESEPDDSESEPDDSESEPDDSDDGESDSLDSEEYIPESIKAQRDLYNNKLNRIDDYTINTWLIVNNIEHYISSFIRYTKMVAFVTFLLHICFMFNLNPHTLWIVLIWIYRFIRKLFNNNS